MAVTIAGDNSVSVVVTDGPSVSVTLPADSGASSVVVSSGAAPLPVVVADSPAVAVDVEQSQLSGVDVYGGIGPTIFVNGTMTGVVGTIGINPFLAGANITISTAGGSITVIGRNPPVYSVQGKTGTVTLVAADITAAAASHTHVQEDIASSLTFDQTLADDLQMLEASVGLKAAIVHTHSTTNITGLTATIKSFANVFSVQGKTGTVTLTTADLTAAAASHSHSTTDITGLTATMHAVASQYGAPGGDTVFSVQGKTGAITLTTVDISAAAFSHTHVTTDIAGLTATIRSLSPVFSVQGKTGTVTLTTADLTAAAASHTHATTDITGLTATIKSFANVFSVQGKTGTVTLTTADLTAAAASHTHATTDVSGLTATIRSLSPVFSVQGKTGTVTLTTADISAAAASHTHLKSEVGLANVDNTSDSSKPLSSAANNALAQKADKFHASLHGPGGADEVPLVNGSYGLYDATHGGLAMSFNDGDVYFDSGFRLALLNAIGMIASVNGISSGANVSIQGGVNVNVATVGNVITISAAGNTSAVAAVLWPSFILGG